MIVWTIDPGLRATGLAEHGVAASGAVLAAAALCRTEQTPGWGEYQGPDVVALEAQCEQAAAWFLARRARADLIAFEWPTIYDPRVAEKQGRHDQAEKDPNDLLGLTAINLGILQRLRAAGVKAPSRAVLARLWTQGTPKRIRQRRYLETLEKRPRELAVIVEIKPAHLRHNTIDACHMGRWICDRLNVDRSLAPG